MKIVYNINGTYNAGGMERVLSNKVNYLANLPNYQVYIITTRQKGRQSFYAISPKVRCIDLGINYPEKETGNLIALMLVYLIKYFKHKIRLEKTLREINPDIAISMFTSDVGLLYKIKNGSKKILEFHFSREFRLSKNRSGIMRLMDIILTHYNDTIISKYDRFIVLTNQDKESWGNLDNIRVIYNFIPKGSRNICPSSLENKRALAIGRLGIQKNFELLVELWSEISKIIDDWTLTIVGVGDDYLTLQNRIIEAKLTQVINIVPATKSIEDYYKDCSLFLMTSRYEGLPMVLLEAQNHGVPIVAFDCKCGPREIIHHGTNGYLIENGNNTDYIEKVCKLMDNTALRKEFGKKAKENSANFTEEKIMPEWVKLFEEVTA